MAGIGVHDQTAGPDPKDLHPQQDGGSD